jgi:hypothetical protein
VATVDAPGTQAALVTGGQAPQAAPQTAAQAGPAAAPQTGPAAQAGPAAAPQTGPAAQAGPAAAPQTGPAGPAAAQASPVVAQAGHVTAQAGPAPQTAAQAALQAAQVHSGRRVQAMVFVPPGRPVANAERKQPNLDSLGQPDGAGPSTGDMTRKNGGRRIPDGCGQILVRESSGALVRACTIPVWHVCRS